MKKTRKRKRKLNNLRVSRYEKNMTQFDLAVEVGCSVQNINLIESGKRLPRVDLASRIAKTLGKTIPEIFPDL